MKRIVIILAVILTSALTALSITKKENKTDNVRATFEKAVIQSNNLPATHTASLGTAD
jgi:hypothetical protein